MSNKSKSDKMFTSTGSMNTPDPLMDCVNLKIAQRPVKFYKLIHCDKSMICDYNYVIDKIKSNTGNSDWVFTLYIISSQEEIKIKNELDWREYFEESGKSVMDLVDSKNTLKIEYTVQREGSTKLSSSISIKSPEDNLTKLFQQKEEIGLEIIRTVFSMVNRSDTIKNKIKSELLNSVLKSETNLDLNTKTFDSLLKNHLDQTLIKIQKLSKLSLEIKEEDSEVILIEDDSGFDLPNFSSYYTEKDKEDFRSKMLSEHFSELKY